MKLLLPAVFAAAALLLAAPAAAPAAERRSAVTPWIEQELDVIASHRLNPPRAARALALVSRSMYLAALIGRGDPDAAVAGAASVALEHLFPDEAARIGALAAEHSESEGFALGAFVGRIVVTWAKYDGSASVGSATPPAGPGFWVPTPPAFAPALEPLAGKWRPWNLRWGAQFRPGPPAAYGSPQFLSELSEVYAISRTLTDEQKQIASLWADAPGTVTPPGHWNLIALELLREADWDTLMAARLLAALNTAQADAFIACWDAKFTYWSLRPVTAIRSFDLSWLSYIPTPPFPSYVSGHSTTSGAASTVLGAAFPERAAALAELAEEAAVSRLYGGIHFRSDNEVGLQLGRRVGAVAVRAYGLEQ